MKPSYGLGALMLGASIGNPDHDDSIRMIHKALDAGIKLIGTADAYPRGSPRSSSEKRSRGVGTTSSWRRR
jgi:aryl-alcohol dehydrogenase-like predicted oxidoreductase